MIKEQDNLKEAIVLLKKKQAIEFKLLKEQINVIHESIKPVNLIKNAVHQVTAAPDIKDDIVGSILGLASGFVTKKLFVGGSHNPITKIAGALLQMGVTNIASNNSGTLRSIGEKVMQFVLKKTNKEKLKNSVSL